MNLRPQKCPYTKEQLDTLPLSTRQLWHISEQARKRYPKWNRFTDLTEQTIIDADAGLIKTGVPRGLRAFLSNGVFVVQHFQQKSEMFGMIDHFMIRWYTGANTEIPWMAKQNIKNELVGAGRTAIEVFPSEADLVDTANMYHLWAFPGGFRFDFGLHMPAHIPYEDENL